MRARIGRSLHADECRAHGLPIDLDRHVRLDARPNEYANGGDSRLDLGELAGPFLLRLDERVRGARGQGRSDEGAVRLGCLDELSERGLALRDVEEVGRRAEDRLGPIEAIERIGEVPRLLELEPLRRELACGGAIGVGDRLRVGGGRTKRESRESREGERDGRGARKK